MHIATNDIAATRNLMLAVERCHLEVEAMVAAPYAAGLGAIADDEADVGAAVDADRGVDGVALRGAVLGLGLNLRAPTGGFGADIAATAGALIVVFGGVTNALLPLYAVVAGAALLLGWELVRGDARSRELGPVALPLALFVAWTGLSLAWTKDLRQGAITLLFFILPFGVLLGPKKLR